MRDNFQIILLVIFIAAGVLGLLVFSGAIPIGGTDKNEGQGTIVIWGTVKSRFLSPLLEDFNKVNETFFVQYVEKSEATFNDDLLEAVASGKGPDMFFLSDDLVFNYKNKIFAIPYESYSQSTFEITFVEGGKVFAHSNGILAFPITIDPLVMYYNRSILDANNIVKPPATWEEFTKLVPILTKKDESNKIFKSTTAFGQYSNVLHAKDIISTLFMQAGNPIVIEKDGRGTSVLKERIGQYDLDSILKFYTDFSDPLGPLYSWNKSFPNSVDAFSAENSVFYFGYASELETLVNRNPNQNFFIAPIPQIGGSPKNLTGGRFTGVAILASTKNFNTAVITANLLTSSSFSSKFADALGVAPARRDLLGVKKKDAYSPIIYSSALIARSWLDPSPKDTDKIFRGMIENILSGNLSISDALTDANSKLGLLLLK